LKQFATYTWSGGDTFFNCPGDSGGPRVIGTRFQRGEILGINSGRFVADNRDIVANAVTYRNDILSIVDKTDHGNICYRVSVEGFGWLPAVCDGTVAGTTGEFRRMEAIQIWSPNPALSVCYDSALEGIGWQGVHCGGDLSGTINQSRRLEAVRVWVAGPSGTVHVSYQGAVQDFGWLGNVSDGAVAGTTGQSRRMEAIRIWLP
jgi:uncharacterized protein YjdB